MPTPCPICSDRLDFPEAEACPPCAGLFRWVRAYFADEPNYPITPATHFINDLGVESLDYMDWLLEAEEKLDIMISDHQAERIQTVGEFVRSLKVAGARWPDDLDIEVAARGRWCRQPYRWAVVPRQSQNESLQLASTDQRSDEQQDDPGR